MNDTYTAHCRFCAKLKPYGKLVNLETDEGRRRKVVERLMRFSLELFDFVSPYDALAKTVCFPCMESLDSAFEFISNVEASQCELRALGTVHVKQEVLDDDQSNNYLNDTTSYHEEKCSEPTLKIEVEIAGEVSQESEISSNNKLLKESTIEKEQKIKADSLARICVNDSSWKDYSWLCAYCDIMFPSIDELKEHSMKSHGCCNAYRCTDCKVRKLNLDSFIKHIKYHRNNLKLSCYKCHKIFSRQYDALVHKKVHVTTEFKCPGCNETFATKEPLLEHCQAYNKDKKIRLVPPEHLTKDLKCVFCHKQFRYKGGLTTHLLTQHREKTRDHTCDKCGKCFLNKANLTGHMLMHDDIRPYVCEICKHCFRLRSQLNRHMGIHDNKKPFTCEQCGRGFRLKKQLRTHSIVHTDKNPYTCSYCQKGFKHKSTFVQHERQHTGERPYKCEICHREFTNWPNYNKHMKRRHAMNMAKSQQSLESSRNLPLSKLDVEVASDPMQSKSIFIPKSRGRPKIIKGINVKDINYKEIKDTSINPSAFNSPLVDIGLP